MQTIQQLNQHFSLDTALQFHEGPNGTVMIHVQTPVAEAKICTYGAQVLSYKPVDSASDMLFLSPQSAYGEGKAIRGGVPICWPWFGDDPSGHGRPAHGFARNQVWHVIATNQAADGKVSVTLQMLPNALSQGYWQCDFDLQLTVTIGNTLKMQLTTHNRDQHSFVISQALHTYFEIGDIEKLKLRGLDNRYYLDKTRNFAEKLQQGDITFFTETDRIYLNSPRQLFIEDSTLARQIMIDSHGSQTTVVWNPWNKIVILKDMLNTAYKQFVCVETANAADNSIELAPDQSHTLIAEYRMTNLA